jgi:hypothetical protein
MIVLALLQHPQLLKDFLQVFTEEFKPQDKEGFEIMDDGIDVHLGIYPLDLDKFTQNLSLGCILESTREK